MPNGRTHTKASLIAAPIIGAAFLFSGYPTSISAAATAGTLVGVLIGPDLDVDAGNYSLYILRRTPLIGRPLAWLWRFLWWPYSKLAAHRGFSHWPVIGTIGRLLYIAVILVIPAAIIDVRFFVSPLVAELAPVFITGLAASDLLHIVMDAL